MSTLMIVYFSVYYTLVNVMMKIGYYSKTLLWSQVNWQVSRDKDRDTDLF